MGDLEDLLRAEVTRRSEEFTPPPGLPRHIEARASRHLRRRRQRLGAGALVAGAAALVLAVVLIPPGGQDGDSLRTADDRRQTTTSTTEASSTTTPSTTAPSSTTTSTTATTPSSTTEPAAQPVTIGELTALSYPFAEGIDLLPPRCRAYWEARRTSLAPAAPTDFFPPTTNGIEILAGGTTIADVDGDGVDDGVAAFHCTYPGSPPAPGGLLVLRADDRAVLFNDFDELNQRNVGLTGDPRTCMRTPVVVAPPGQPDAGQIVARIGSYRPDDANASPSSEADARFVVEGNRVRLVDLTPLA